MSQSATPATQNDMTTCLETCQKEKFCSFPHRHGEATGKPETRDETCGSIKTSISCETSSNFHKLKRAERTCFAASPIDTARPQENQRLEWEHQNEHFVRDFLRFSHFAASKSTFSYEFSLEPDNLQPQNRCFVRGFRQFSAHVRKCHACHGICTLSPLDAALPMRFTKNTPQDASKVLRLPRKNDDGRVQSAAPATKTATHLLKTSQKYCACHAKRLATRCRTRLNVTKCHACHAKRSNQTSETSKKDHLCKTSHRHGHTVLTRTVANGCGRLRSRTQRRANTPSTPRPPEWNGNPCYAFGKKTCFNLKVRPLGDS